MPNQMNYSPFILRGGGCGMTKTKIALQTQNNSIQTDAYDFFLSFNHYIYIIESKANVAANEQESQEIMIAIRWFIFQEENIYKINKNVQSVKKSYNLILDGIRRLLISCQVYIRSDSFKCLYILQITTSLSKVIFSFHLMNDERFMKCETQNYFLDICDELQQQIKIERNDLIQNQIELFLFLTKTSFEIAPNNSKEKEEILKGSLKGIVSSLINMSPDTELLESLFKGACLLYKMQDISKKRKQYEVFYQIDMLQWEVISYFKYEKYKNLEDIILQIEAIYDTIVKSSKNWKEHYIWIQMIGKILVFNPRITIKKLGQLNNSLNIGVKSISQIWQDYTNRGILIQINNNKDSAVIQLNQLKNNKILLPDRLMLEESFKGWEGFLILKQFLMNEQNQNTPYTFSSYLKCKLDLFKEDSQNQEKLVTSKKMQKLLSFIISTKLINLIKQNDQNLGEILKIQKQFQKDQQVYTRLLQWTVNSQFKKIIYNIQEYLTNAQNILKILKLNQINYCQSEQFKQENLFEYNILQQLKYLMRLLEQILLKTIQEINDQQNQFSKENVETDEIKMLQQQKELVQVELKNLNLKDNQFLFVNEFQLKLHALPIATLNQKSYLKEAQSILKLIEHSQKQITNLEVIQLQKNNLIECFRSLLHKLYYFYENKKFQIQKDVNEFILSFRKILILQCEIESFSQAEEFVNIKQQLLDMLSYSFIFNQSLDNLKLKLQLTFFKESFQKILTVQSEDYLQLQEVINLDQFLINVLINYPLNLIINQNQYQKQILPELITMKVTEEDLQNNLYKYQGTIEYLIFIFGIDEQIIKSEKTDLEMIQKEFEETLIEESNSISVIYMKIIAVIQIDESIKNVSDEKFNQQKLIIEREKYENVLQQLRNEEKNKIFQNIEHFQQFINQMDKVVKELRDSVNQNLKLFKIPIIDCLNDLKQLQDKIKQNNYDEEEKIEERNSHLSSSEQQNNQKYEKIEIALKDQQNIENNLNNLSDKKYHTHLQILINVVKIQEEKISKSKQQLTKLLEEVKQFRNNSIRIKLQKGNLSIDAYVFSQFSLKLNQQI